MPFTDEQITSLNSLREAGKFDGEPNGLYSGAPTQELRDQYDGYANDLIDHLLGIPSKFSDGQVLVEFRRILAHFESADTDDKEQICSVLEQIMDILEVRSSGGLLNEWLYGFDPTEL